MTQYDYVIAKAKVRMAYEEADKLIEYYYYDSEMTIVKYVSGRKVINYSDPNKDTETIFDDPVNEFEMMLNTAKNHLGFWSEI